jgi:hypothetical protein
VPGDGLALTVADTSADGGLTVVDATAVLFAMFGSGARELTVAVVLATAGALGVPTTVAVAEAPDKRVPRLQVTVPPACEHVPCEATALENVTLAGSASVSTAPVVSLGPAFATRSA